MNFSVLIKKTFCICLKIAKIVNLFLIYSYLDVANSENKIVVCNFYFYNNLEVLKAKIRIRSLC